MRLAFRLPRRPSAGPSRTLDALCHELRSPVASVRALARAARSGSGLRPDERDEALRLVEQHAEHLQSLIEELRAQCRPAGPGRPAYDVWLPDVVHAAASAAGLSPGRLRLVVDDDAALVHLDATVVRQILTNLVENACRYGSPTADVEVLAQRRRSALALTVTDQPAAVPVPRLGDGLGAGIVRRLVQRAGGSVETTTGPTGGRRVRVVLPLA
ncbi:MAG: ATPase [Frankiales bacterium]|nr:ATPase [Frankiales bacterium]